jgi:hypothetical protein
MESIGADSIRYANRLPSAEFPGMSGFQSNRQIRNLQDKLQNKIGEKNLLLAYDIELSN